ncbi:MAG: hypothetical protein JOZ02_22190 [Acidobacteria bacterium]|nr:hypothetical protein [Acidobacteriota bacterium]
MTRRAENSGLRRHRPKKPFRFEYAGNRYGAFPKAERPFWRAFDEMEREQDGYLDLVERYERYKSGRGGGEEDE